ncbi:MAG: Rpp14/Pop5 family protein [Desulfurococcales archaeon]|nr:Rpp14/Pop5 family protein [Desulfurococcales archaeon]
MDEIELAPLLALSAVASLAMVLSVLAYAEARRVRELLEAVLGSARARELARIRRAFSRKPRRRYIVFQVISDDDVSEKSLYQAIMRSARRLLGSAAIADSGLTLAYYNAATRRGVLRVRSDYKNAAMAVLSTVRRAGNSNILAVPITASGTIKKAKRAADRF